MITICCTAQKNEKINPSGKFYFGAEIVSNAITSLENEKKNSLSGGLHAEYYFARHWSIVSGIKYYEIGISYYRPESERIVTGGTLFNSVSYIEKIPERFGNFKGSAITIPLQIKWEFRLYRNLGASLNLGATYTFETKSEYGAYSSEKVINYSKIYGGYISGVGFNYFVNKNSAIYLSFDGIDSSKKTSNQFTSIGFKYTFKEQ